MEDQFQDELWNMGMAYLMRLDGLLTRCTMHHMNNEPISWYATLLRLYIEIHPKLKDKEKEEANRLLKLLTDEKKTAMSDNIGNISVAPFIDFELYLRKMMENRKMLTPKGDDPSHSFKNG